MEGGKAMSSEPRKLILLTAVASALSIGALCPDLLLAEQDGAKGQNQKKLTAGLNESSSRNGSKPGASGSSSSPATAQPDADKLTYRIGVEDELQISVWREPELTQVVVVRPDGMITLPLLSDVRVVGLTPEELQAQLTDKLKPFVNEPQVTVSTRAIRSRKAYVVGQVPRPGAYPLNGRKTVLEVLSEAGGLGPFARSGSIYILRKDGDKETRIRFEYKKAVAGKGYNIELLPGDMVVVP